MTRVLVTGGTGSLGNALVPRLLEDLTIERVIVYSRDEQKQNEMACRIRNDRLAFYLGDVRDRVLTDGEIAEIWAACRNTSGAS